MGSPAGPPRVEELDSISLLLIGPGGAAHCFAVELNAEAGPARHLDVTVAVLERSGDDIEGLVVVVRVVRMADLRRRRDEVEAGGGADPELAVAVDSEAKPKNVADGGEFLRLGDAAPEVEINEDDVECLQRQRRRHVGEADDGLVCRERDLGDAAANPCHPFEIPGGVLDILDIEFSHLAYRGDRDRHRPGLVGIEPKPLNRLGVGLAQQSERRQLLVRGKDATLELDSAEAVLLNQQAVAFADRLWARLASLPVLFVAVEDVRNELDSLPIGAAPELRDWLVEGLAEDVPAGHLDSGADVLQLGHL